jgi:hypothetical protein
MSHAEKQAKAMHDLQEHKKMKSNMYRNIILAAVIFVLSFLVEVVLVKILLILIAFGNAVVALLLYNFFAFSRDTQVYTKIYEDRFEHSQPVGFSGDFLHSTVYFDDVEKSCQNNHGRLIIALKSERRSTFVRRDKKGAQSEFVPNDDTVSLYFPDTQSKLKLINEFYEQLKYPHKEYNVIDDSDDYYSEEDMKWDSLHKHGL